MILQYSQKKMFNVWQNGKEFVKFCLIFLIPFAYIKQIWRFAATTWVMIYAKWVTVGISKTSSTTQGNTVKPV